MNQVQELFICSIDGHLIGEQKGSDEFFIGRLKPAGSLPGDKGPSRRRGPLSHGNIRLRTSHYSFIPIHKCPFVKKRA